MVKPDIEPISVESIGQPLLKAAVHGLLDLHRTTKCRRAKPLIETAGRVRIKRWGEVLTIPAVGHRPLTDLDPDSLLELVERMSFSEVACTIRRSAQKSSARSSSVRTTVPTGGPTPTRSIRRTTS
jgi:hypothetical protein